MLTLKTEDSDFEFYLFFTWQIDVDEKISCNNRAKSLNISETELTVVVDAADPVLALVSYFDGHLPQAQKILDNRQGGQTLTTGKDKKFNFLS